MRECVWEKEVEGQIYYASRRWEQESMKRIITTASGAGVHKTQREREGKAFLLLVSQPILHSVCAAGCFLATCHYSCLFTLCSNFLDFKIIENCYFQLSCYKSYKLSSSWQAGERVAGRQLIMGLKFSRGLEPPTLSLRRTREIRA